MLVLIVASAHAQTSANPAPMEAYQSHPDGLTTDVITARPASTADAISPANQRAIAQMTAAARRDAAAMTAPQWYRDASKAGGTTFTVNTLAGDNDGVCGLSRGEDCSLLEAVALANVVPDFNVIEFSVSGTIALSAPVVLLEAAHLDGTTAPGGTGSVFLDGQDTVENVVTVSGGTGSIIEGLTIGQSARSGVLIVAPASNVSVVGNFIGTNAAGADLGNDTTTSGSAGIRLEGAAGTMIGGSTASESNVIGFNRSGIADTQVTTGTTIVGNFIGTNAANANLGNTLSGMFLTSSANTVGGTAPGAGNLLAFNGDSGLVFSGPDALGNVALGNFVGTNANGDNLGNATLGIRIQVGASNNTIGGTEAGAENVIGFNAGGGIEINGFTELTMGNRVLGNFVGTNAAGANLGNSGQGIVIANAEQNTVGGTLPDEANTIGFNTTHGIVIANFTDPTIENSIAGNFIGTNAAGADLGNAESGVVIQDASSNLIGGDTPGAGNTIEFNGDFGVRVQSFNGQPAENNRVQGNVAGFNLGGILITGAGATGNLAQGNVIGTNSAGDNRGNVSFGITIQDASDNTVGGTQPGEGNIVGFTPFSIGVVGASGENTNNVVEGNFVGTNPAGDHLGLDVSHGIYVQGLSGNRVGGSDPGAGNTVGFAVFGIVINGTAGVTTGNLVEGNFVGTDSMGRNLGNSNMGVIVEAASGNTVGGTTPGSGNVIGFNQGAGVVVFGPSSQDNAIVRNAIFDNNALGIDLSANSVAGDGVTVNDGCGDSDAGPNGHQNFPTLLLAQARGTRLTIDFDLDTSAGDHHVEFFSVPAADPSGFGEGELFLGTAQVSVSATCDETFQAELAVEAFDASTDVFLTATATRVDVGLPGGLGGSSELSAALAIEILDRVFDDGFEADIN